jgi:membrane-bound ClpP family serine protease
MTGLSGNFVGPALVDSVFVVAGWIGVLIEFVRPGWVVPGVTGGVLLLVGLSRMPPEHPRVAIAASIPFLLAALCLLALAWKASRNKRAL